MYMQSERESSRIIQKQEKEIIIISKEPMKNAIIIQSIASAKTAKEKTPPDKALVDKLTGEAEAKAKTAADAKAALDKLPAEPKEKFKPANEFKSLFPSAGKELWRDRATRAFSDKVE